MVCPQRFYYQQQLGLAEGMMGYLKEKGKNFLRKEGKPVKKMSSLTKGNLAHFILKHVHFRHDLKRKKEEIDTLMRNQGFSPESDEAKKMTKKHSRIFRK